MAVLPLTRVWFSFSSAVPVGLPCVPAGDAAAVQRRVAVDLAVIQSRRPEQVLDAAAAGVGRDVAVHLAVVERQHSLATGAEVVAAGDAAADASLAVLPFTWMWSSFAVPSTFAIPPPPRPPLSSCDGGWVCWLSLTELWRSVSVATLDGSKVALTMPPPASAGAVAGHLGVIERHRAADVRDPAAEVLDRPAGDR